MFSAVSMPKGSLGLRRDTKTNKKKQLREGKRANPHRTISLNHNKLIIKKVKELVFMQCAETR